MLDGLQMTSNAAEMHSEWPFNYGQHVRIKPKCHEGLAIHFETGVLQKEDT